MVDDVYIGPIQHSNSMCQKTGCECWCQACERHNWRHARERDASPDPSWSEDADGYVVAPLVNRGTLDAAR